MKKFRLLGILFLQALGMLVLSWACAYTQLLGRGWWFLCGWGLLPLLCAVSAYAVTKAGVSNYLAWIAPPFMGLPPLPFLSAPFWRLSARPLEKK